MFYVWVGFFYWLMSWQWLCFQLPKCNLAPNSSTLIANSHLVPIFKVLIASRYLPMALRPLLQSWLSQIQTPHLLFHSLILWERFCQVHSQVRITLDLRISSVVTPQCLMVRCSRPFCAHLNCSLSAKQTLLFAARSYFGIKMFLYTMPGWFFRLDKCTVILVLLVIAVSFGSVLVSIRLIVSLAVSLALTYGAMVLFAWFFNAF